MPTCQLAKQSPFKSDRIQLRLKMKKHLVWYDTFSLQFTVLPAHLRGQPPSLPLGLVALMLKHGGVLPCFASIPLWVSQST